MTVQTTELDKPLENIHSSLEQRISGIQGPVPSTLYHYTSASGLRGIVESNRFWATHYRFLNDASEINYGAYLFNSIVDDWLKKEVSDEAKDLLEKVRDPKSIFEMSDCYLSCLCEQDDLLNQWRAYAGTGGGYAIGFEAKFIGMRLERIGQAQEFNLQKVIYDESLQRCLINKLLGLVVNCLDEVLRGGVVSEAIYYIARCCQFVDKFAVNFLTRFKHQAFAVEKEWRLCHIAWMNQEQDLLFRDGLYGLTPYICLDPSPSVGIFREKLPISSVTHAPCQFPALAKFSVEKILQKNGYRVPIKGSSLPVRI